MPYLEDTCCTVRKGNCITLQTGHLAAKGQNDMLPELDDRFVWASVGDSWASGVSFSGQETEYDGDKNGCHRWKDSYGPMMERNTTWTIGVQKFNFAACSGCRMRHILKEPQGDNPPQVDLVGNPQMMTYQVGGNDCLFGNVIEDCIYQPGINYGAEYPDDSGQCARRIRQSNDYVNNDTTKAGWGLYIDELKTVRDTLNHPAVRDNKDFKLYILSYVKFFNLGANYCDDISFGAFAWVPGGNAPKVSNRLRTDMNDGVDRVNKILARIANDVNDPRVKYLDISPAFEGHRFCENHHKYLGQWREPDVWLWNFNPPIMDPPADPSFMDSWLSQGKLPDGTVLSLPNGTDVGVEMQGGADTDGGTGSGRPQPTWSQRPFHPKPGRTEVIGNIVIAQALADKIPGVVGSSPPATGACDCDESGCSPESPTCCADGTC
ncbi:SGNH hydrolase [Xylariaceae sp. FL1019]|nr:SGNH hydrolase [Xylariaceae sp. FL1019]